MSLVFEALRQNDDTASPQQAKGSVLTQGDSLRKSRLWRLIFWVLTGVLLSGGYALLQPYAYQLILKTTQHVSAPAPDQVQAMVAQSEQIKSAATEAIQVAALVPEPVQVDVAQTASDRVQMHTQPSVAQTVHRQVQPARPEPTQVQAPKPVQIHTQLAVSTPIQTVTQAQPLVSTAVATPQAPTSASSVKNPTGQRTAVAAKKAEPAVITTQLQEQKQAISSTVPAASRTDQRTVLARFNNAMSSGQSEQAAQLLEQARQSLGPEHLIVLRMEGYYCLQMDCNDQARNAYQTILTLLPGDKEAGYNLAVLDGRNGRLTQAHERVNQLLQRYPDDKALRALQQTLFKERR